MTGTASSVRSLVLLGALGLGVALSGCATVSPEDLDARLEEVRQDMEEGDQQVADEVDGVNQRVADLEGRVSSLEQELQSLQSDFNTTVQRLESALRFSTPVHFAYDAAEVRPEDEEYLDRFGSVVSEYYSNATVTVEGFTDPAGSQSYNLQLGQRRADAVRQYLADNTGLSADQIRAVSYGENTDRLIAPDAQGPGEAGLTNRRVSLVVDYQQRPGAGSPMSGSSTGES